MMIPGKIYVEIYENGKYLDSELPVMDSSWNLTDCGVPCIEYIRVPIAKRFDVEKPLKSGAYLVSNHMPAPVWLRIDYYHVDTNTWSSGIPYWFAEIILPTIPEEE